MEMTHHTLKYIHNRRGCCKAEKAPDKKKQQNNKKNKNYINKLQIIILNKILILFLTIYEMREQWKHRESKLMLGVH